MLLTGFRHRDKLHLKSTQDGKDSYAALEKKAELYDKLVRGEVPDEEEKEKYSVDFLRKGTLDDEAEEMENFKYDGRENFGTAEVPVVIDRGTGTAEEKPKSGVGWGLGKSTGLSVEQKQLIRYEITLCMLFSGSYMWLCCPSSYIF